MKKLVAISLMLIAGIVNAQEILIFGGDNNKEFLGCLTCNEMAGNSVWNEMSTYGWKNGYGKWNPYGQFKNPYSTAAGSVLGATDLATAASSTTLVTNVVAAQGYMSLTNSGTNGLLLTTNIGNQDGGSTYEVLSETMSLTD